MRVDGVVFEFRELIVGGLGPHSETATGEVLLSEDGMVMTLEVSCPGERPYHIRGRRLPNGSYSGRHVGAPDDTQVLASWRKGGGGQWEGTWRETPADEPLLRFAFSLLKTEESGDHASLASPGRRPLERGNHGPQRLAHTSEERKPGSEVKAGLNSPRRGWPEARVTDGIGERRTGGKHSSDRRGQKKSSPARKSHASAQKKPVKSISKPRVSKGGNRSPSLRRKELRSKKKRPK
jgi:hypothetical protein